MLAMAQGSHEIDDRRNGCGSCPSADLLPKWAISRRSRGSPAHYWRRIELTCDNRFVSGNNLLAGRGRVMASQQRSQRERMLRQRVLAGDEAAWRTLYDETFADLRAYIWWRCAGRSHLAEEVIQETWLVAVRRMRQFDPRRASFLAWLRGIAGNLLRNHLRRQQRQAHEALEECSLAAAPDPSAGLCEQAELIAQALAELPQHYEAVLRAKYLEQTSALSHAK